MSFNDRVRARRKELGLSQQELAKRAGIGQSSIGQIENGRNKSTTKIIELAKALETTPEYLTQGITANQNNVLNEARNNNYGDQTIVGGNQSNYTLYQDTGIEPTKAKLKAAESEYLKSMPLLDIDQAARYLLNPEKEREQIYDKTERATTFIPHSGNTIGARIADDTYEEFSRERIKQGDILIIEPQIPPRDGDLILLCLQNTGYTRGIICRLTIDINGQRYVRYSAAEAIPMPAGAIIGGVIVELKRRLIPTDLLKSRLDPKYDIYQSQQVQ